MWNLNWLITSSAHLLKTAAGIPSTVPRFNAVMLKNAETETTSHCCLAIKALIWGKKTHEIILGMSVKEGMKPLHKRPLSALLSVWNHLFKMLFSPTRLWSMSKTQDAVRHLKIRITSSRIFLCAIEEQRGNSRDRSFKRNAMGPWGRPSTGQMCV